MPLIDLTTSPGYHPAEKPELDTLDQQMIAMFGEALPRLFVRNTGLLLMDADTPPEGVQVSHKLAGPRDVNAPDLWVLIEFSEDGLTEVQQTEVTYQVKKLLLGWFSDNGFAVPRDYACDVRWTPSHGFLCIGGVKADW